MPVTTYKGYEVQTTGSNTGTWGDVLNDDALAIIDNNVGGVSSVALSSSNVILTVTQSGSAILRLSGTLLANVQITTSCQGFFFVENATTGNFTVTITNGVAGVVVPQGGRSTCIADTSQGVRLITGEFVAGTSMLFVQTTAPTGWTKITSTDNALLRLVSGTPSSGGSNDFTTVNTSTLLTRANLPNDTITTTTNGAHTHTVTTTTTGINGNDQNNPHWNYASNILATPSATTSSNGDHTHTIALNGGVSQTALNLNIKYLDVTRATKA